MSPFRQVFTEVHNERKLEEPAQARHALDVMCSEAGPDRPKWRLIERIVAHKYRRMEKQEPPKDAMGAIDWPALKQWLADHWLQILGLLLQLLVFLVPAPKSPAFAKVDWNEWLTEHLRGCGQCHESFMEMGNEGMCWAAFERFKECLRDAQEAEEARQEPLKGRMEGLFPNIDNINAAAAALKPLLEHVDLLIQNWRSEGEITITIKLPVPK